MVGIFFIMLVVCWGGVSAWVTFLIVKRCGINKLRYLFTPILFAAIFYAPVFDEIIGRWQFESLCNQYANFITTDPIARNRQVFFEGKIVKPASNTIVEVRISRHMYRDTETKKILFSYHYLQAGGGWLNRTFGVLEGNIPLLFDYSCAPKEISSFKKEFNISVIN